MLYGPFASSFKSIVKSQPNYNRLSIFIGQGNSVVASLLTTQPSGGSFPALESRWLPCCGVWRTTPQALPPVPPIDPPPHPWYLQPPWSRLFSFEGNTEHRPQILEVNLSSIYPLASILWELDLWVTYLGRILTETVKKEYDTDVSPVLSGPW